MKKIILLVVLAFVVNQYTNAQNVFGIKVGINYNSDSFQDVKDNIIEENGEGRTGYHAGIWFRTELPIVGLYLRPEIIYTNLGAEINYANIRGTGATVSDYDFQKIDIPLLVGKRILKFGNIFAGPSFQYILDSGFGMENLEKDDIENITVGIQLGAGVEIGSIGIDVRWERGFNDIETKFFDKNSNTNIEFDTRVNQIIIGLSYTF